MSKPCACKRPECYAGGHPAPEPCKNVAGKTGLCTTCRFIQSSDRFEEQRGERHA